MEHEDSSHMYNVFMYSFVWFYGIERLIVLLSCTGEPLCARLIDTHVRDYHVFAGRVRYDFTCV